MIPNHEFSVEVQELVKRYPRSPKNAVDGASFAVQRGTIFGLLGPNGAGKTTTIGVLTTPIKPTSGSARISGIDVVADPMAVKQRIAVVPQRPNLDQSLRVRDILTFHAAYHGVPRAQREARADMLLRELGLEGRGKEKIGWFSGGMGQRVMLARALMHTPDVLFLDEPTNNLDPQTRLFLWERIQALHEQGMTVLLTTHDMEEADRLCERIAIMDNGKILVIDTPGALRKLIPGGSRMELTVRVPEHLASLQMTAPDVETRGGQGGAIGALAGVSGQISQLISALSMLPGVTRVEEVKGNSNAGYGDGNGGSWMAMKAQWMGPQVQQSEQVGDTHLIRLYGEQRGELVAGVVHTVASAGIELRDLHLSQPSLEDVFIHLTGRKLRS